MAISAADIACRRCFFTISRKNLVEELNSKFFNSVIQTMQNNYATIASYFENRSTNASAESFNAKVKAFRNQFRGVADIPFFIFRLATIFA